MSKRNSKTPTRLIIGAFAATQFLARRASPHRVNRILVSLYYEGLGDVILLTPLIANLRKLYPGASIVLTIPPAYAPLYAKHPYGLTAIPYDRRDPTTFFALRDSGPYDLAVVPFENRQAWLARAAGARWVRGFEGDKWHYRLPVDELVPYPPKIEPVSDMWARLAGGDGSAVYDPADWPAPPPRPTLDTRWFFRGVASRSQLACSRLGARQMARDRRLADAARPYGHPDNGTRPRAYCRGRRSGKATCPVPRHIGPCRPLEPVG